ncbi:MAG TPA: glycosyltransferase family 2 protein [Chthoniobacteraceae bacterium]|jgi:glycosyltransferase involved in cell wall biosynthesis
MKLSLITPCFNSGAYLEATIRSVLDQGITDLEYLVVDGGSTDATPEIIARYRHQLAWSVSERDRGQVDALNKGFTRATGEIVGFLNADDVLRPGALAAVLAAFQAQPETDLVYGEVEWIDAEGKHLGDHAGRISSLDEVLDIYRVWWNRRQWVQPEVFYRRSLKERVGSFDERYQLAFDYDFWVRCFRAGARVQKLPQQLVQFRLHAAQKSTASEQAADEIRAIVQEHLSANLPLNPFTAWRLRADLSYDLYQGGKLDSPGQARPSFAASLLRNPSWLLCAPVRERLLGSLRRSVA